MQSSSLSKSFMENGHFKFKVDKKILINLRNDFIKTFDKAASLKKSLRIKNDNDLISLYRSNNRKIWTSVYDLLKFNINLYSLSGENFIKDICKITQINYPYFSTKPYVRVDMPHDTIHSFKAHQDYPFNLGSKNSIVIWIPLQETNKIHGCIKVNEKSHKSKKVHKADKNLLIDDKNLNFMDVPCKLGEILVFSQYLIHKSGNNISDKIRFSVQLRINDIDNLEYSNRNYFINKNN